VSVASEILCDKNGDSSGNSLHKEYVRGIAKLRKIETKSK